MKIRTKEWSHFCGDGCCYHYGTTLWIDDKEVRDRTFSGDGDAYLYILTEVLKFDVDEEEPDHAEFEPWE